MDSNDGNIRVRLPAYFGKHFFGRAFAVITLGSADTALTLYIMYTVQKTTVTARIMNKRKANLRRNNNKNN